MEDLIDKMGFVGVLKSSCYCLAILVHFRVNKNNSNLEQLVCATRNIYFWECSTFLRTRNFLGGHCSTDDFEFGIFFNVVNDIRKTNTIKKRLKKQPS